MSRPAAFARDGAVFWQGQDSTPTYQAVADAHALRDHFASIPKTDWFYDTAQRFVADLDVAMRQAAEDVEAVLAARQLEHV